MGTHLLIHTKNNLIDKYMGSELKDLKKDLYVKYLDTQRSAIYQSILGCNGELVRKLYRKKRTAEIQGAIASRVRD